MTNIFGKRGAVRNSLQASLPPTRPSPEDSPTGAPLLKLLDRVFLWLPDGQSPGLAAVLLVLVRQAVLPFVIGLTPLVVLILCGLNIAKLMDTSKHEAGLGLFAGVAAFSCIAIVQELNRYAFVRRAVRPAQSLALITIVEIVISLLFSHSRPYTTSWQLTEQLAASAVIFIGLRHRKHIGLVLLAIVVARTAIDLTAPRFLPPRDVTNPAQPTPAAETAIPAVGNMQAWAKLYPGSMVKSAETRTLMGLTSWDVDYTTPASAAQIDSFYQGVARAGGFENAQNLAGLHNFQQASTRNEFLYMVVSDPAGARVIFKARTFANK